MKANIYFINLDKRTDRKSEFLDQFKTVEYDINNIIRVQAIETYCRYIRLFIKSYKMF